MTRILLILGILCAAPALAQEAPSFECAQAATTVEQMICTDPELATLDRRVSDLYRAALEKTKTLTEGTLAAETTLRAQQRGWIKGRDDCWKSDNPKSCVTFSYLVREGELVAKWSLQPEVGQALWTCGTSSTIEIATYFFDTQLPSIRFEIGDTVDVGLLSPTGSGSKYQGSFGRTIWIKGPEAIYDDPDGMTHGCVAVPA
jgi:uncharacterized protein